MNLEISKSEEVTLQLSVGCSLHMVTSLILLHPCTSRQVLSEVLLAVAPQQPLTTLVILESSIKLSPPSYIWVMS